MLRLKTRIGSKYKPGDVVPDDALDAKLSARLIAEGRAERVKASDKTVRELRAACLSLVAATRASLDRVARAVSEASAPEIEGVLEAQREGMAGETHADLFEAVETALEAHRQALAQDEADEAAAAHAKGGSEDKPPAKGGKTDTRKASSGTARKASGTASSGAVEGGAKASPNKAKAGGRQSGKPGAAKAKAAASGEPTDQKRSGAEAARGIHNPEVAGSNPASAPTSSAAADPGSDVPAKVPGGQSPSHDAKRPDGSSKAETGKA